MLSQLAAILLMLDAASFCEKFLLDADYLIQELGRIRQLALTVPMTQESYGPTNSVVDAIWNLEDRLRFLRRMDEQKASRPLKRPDDDESDSPPPPRNKDNPRRKRLLRSHQQEELFDGEELACTRSAEFSRELREVGNAAREEERSGKRLVVRQTLGATESTNAHRLV